MNKTLYILIGVLLVGIVGMVAYLSLRPGESALRPTDDARQMSPQGGDVTGATAPATGSAVAMFTMADIATHNTEASCYTAISGTVYDLTSFIGRHPGGQVITKLCGADGTSMFTEQHGGQEKPEQMLASLKIGVLAK